MNRNILITLFHNILSYYMLLCVLVIVIIYKYIHLDTLDTMNVSREVIKDIESYPNKSLDIFTDKEFKPECCPSFYTKSTGCMCDNDVNHNLLVMRGGNRLLKDTYAKQQKSPYLIGPMCPECSSLDEMETEYFLL